VGILKFSKIHEFKNNKIHKIRILDLWAKITLSLLPLPATRNRVDDTVRLSVCLSHPAAARRCCEFATVGLAGRRYRSIAARPASRQLAAG